MAFVAHRRFAIPLWAVAFCTIALTAPPPATLFQLPPAAQFPIAAVGIAAIVFSMRGGIPWFRAMGWLRTSRAIAPVRPSGYRDSARAAIVVAAGTCVRTLDQPNRIERDDALDLIRMDDDGGWQMPRPPA